MKENGVRGRSRIEALGPQSRYRGGRSQIERWSIYSRAERLGKRRAPLTRVATRRYAYPPSPFADLVRLIGEAVNAVTFSALKCSETAVEPVEVDERLRTNTQMV